MKKILNAIELRIDKKRYSIASHIYSLGYLPFFSCFKICFVLHYDNERYILAMYVCPSKIKVHNGHYLCHDKKWWKKTNEDIRVAFEKKIRRVINQKNENDNAKNKRAYFGK